MRDLLHYSTIALIDRFARHKRRFIEKLIVNFHYCLVFSAAYRTAQYAAYLTLRCV
jgi:hypothetical protein